LAYAGFPGKKDLINNVIEGIFLLDPEHKRIELNLIGPTAGQICSLPALRSRNMKSLPEGIQALGPLPHHQVSEYVRSADFMPLLRSPLRYAQAGFPTKVPESLALGTPILCNQTSDLGEYIHQGVEGFICSDSTPQAFCKSLEQALSLSVQQRSEMRIAARRRAECSFDYRIYSSQLSSFLERIVA
jgi:glycosyltransferase involved in cell wall biosynthesis